MTEDEAKKALFQVHYEYMMHNPREREALYEDYQNKRNLIKKELARAIMSRKEAEFNSKTK